MYLSMSEEIVIFLYAALSGASIMLIYDFLSVAFSQKGCPLFVFNVCDGIFIAVACVVLLFINISVMSGVVRLYEFFGAFLGALIYKLIFSRAILFLLFKATQFIACFFKIFFKIVLTPINFMYKIINKCINVFLRPVKRIFSKLFSLISFKCSSFFKTARRVTKKM